LRAYNERLPAEFRHPDAPLAQEYCKAISDALPHLRNTLAHGSTYLHHGGAMTVRICADMINQVFEKREPTEKEVSAIFLVLEEKNTGVLRSHC
jgi:hypothetical protein